ncbi:MAG: HD domain-containing protein [Bdellovibrionales bacterium]|nr:HD domain-containing protein [Bdellovibrionales bacterium]
MDAKTLPRPQARSISDTQNPSESGLEYALLELLRRKSDETHEHSSRVGGLAREWVEHMHSRSKWLEVSSGEVELGARFHDIGKIAISDKVLNKAGPLSPEERVQMNGHSRIGFELFCNVSSLQQISLAILHHHERWDGAGYPDGLRGSEIPFIARVIGIVDAFDAMTSSRCYQRARSEDAALEEIRLNGGSQFCPDLVEDFAQFLNARNT